ncbi:hypothetical protein NQ315_013457 [Exocentrus adspersus]|uniref:RNase H type-1 domain-containing protein n=1 Tax=Exocentrus adspersus TaxID=1586481 RepID=A0AAV8VDK4_9CUCU|nr:hypothetical protein NQ315_013457 [Exocentrus adspersus]
MLIPKYLDNDLNWWINSLAVAKQNIKESSYVLEIFSDASPLAWGAHCNERKTHGFWSEEQQKLHINHLELIAAFNGLRCFSKGYTNCSILLRIDNTTAVACINKMGSVQFKHLNQISRDIWQYCENNNIKVFASYIKSKENVVADSESRSLNIKSEYSLHEKYIFLPRSSASYPGCSSFIRQAFLKKGIPEDAIPFVLASITRETLRKYDAVFSRWWEFSTINYTHPYAYNLAGILSFIKTIFGKDCSYSTINIHIAALSLFMIIPEEDKNIFEKFYKGLYNLKPPMPKYKYTWDPAPVPDYLQTLIPLEGLSLEKLTYKLVMLVALTSAHRFKLYP